MKNFDKALFYLINCDSYSLEEHRKIKESFLLDIFHEHREEPID